jgi:uroporphyrinogen-III synthase
VPTLSIRPPDSWEDLDTALKQIDKYQWIIFASTNSVHSFASRMQELGIDQSQLKATKLAAIGSATKLALDEYDLPCAFTPKKFIAEGLVEEFPDFADLSGVRILWPRTNVGRNFILDKLQEAGAIVDVAPSYQTNLPENKEVIADKLADLISKKSVDVITFLSAQTCVNFVELLSLGQRRAGDPSEAASKYALPDVIIASIGPETSRAAMEHLGRVDVEAHQFTKEGLIESIIKYLQGAKNAVKNH